MAKRSWTESQLREAVEKSTSLRQVLRLLGLRAAGGNYEQLKKYIVELEIEDGHLKGKGWSKGLSGIGKPRVALTELLVEDSMYQSFKLKKRLFAAGLKKAVCEQCGWCKQANDGRVPVELDHINGNRRDNRLENLRILCPNCHSLQSTHRGLNQKRRMG